MEEDVINDDSSSSNSTMDECNHCNVTNREGLSNISDPLNLFRHDTSANGSIKASIKNDSTSTPVSKATRKRRNVQKRKSEEKVKNQEVDKTLNYYAFQNVVENELPPPPISPVRQPPKPKPISTRTPKVKDQLPWCPAEKLLHRPWKSSNASEPPKPSEPPKQKKSRIPAIDYVMIPNSEKIAKVNNNYPSYTIDDDDDDDDDDYVYDYDYYDGVAEHRTIHPVSTMLPHEKAATHSTKARKIGNERCVNKISRRKYNSNCYHKKKEAEEEKKIIEEENKKEKKRVQSNLKKKKQRQALIDKKRDCIKPYVSSLQCEWSHHCQWGCGYVHLNRATKHMKSNCCYNGLLSPIGDSPLFLKYGNLKPMSLEMQDLMLNEIEHMGPLSSTYGNVLSLAAIGVENGCKATGVINTHVGGFECRGNGAPDCVTMYGRTFHYLTMARDLASGIGK